MAKKRRSSTKKHRISPAHLGEPIQAATSLNASTVAAPQTSSYDANATTFVRVEVRRVLSLAAAFIGVELVLWWLFGHTGLGSTLNNAIKF